MQRKSSDDKTELFERMPVPKAVMNLSVPMILSALVMVVYNLTDTFFVGMLNDPVQTAAVTIAAVLLLSFNAINNLFGIGGSSMMSRALGAKDLERVKVSCSFSFWSCCFFSILFSVIFGLFQTPCLILLGAKPDTLAATADYTLWTVTLGALPAILHVVMAYFIRSEGNAFHASVGTISGCIVNILLDPIFILPWGLDMGASGAGLATLIGNSFATLYFFGFLFVKKARTYVCIDPRKALPSRDIAKGILTVGIPASIQNLLNVLSMTLLNNFAAAYSSTVIASLGIAIKINQVPMQISFGLGNGIGPLVGYNYASGNIDRMKKVMIFTYKVAIVFLVLVSLLLFVFSPQIVRLFMQDPDIVSYGAFYLKGYSVGLTFLCVDFLGVGCCVAIGKGGLTMLFAILRKIILEIPFLLLFNMLYKENGLCFSQAAAEFILAIASVVVLVRFIRKLEKQKRALPTA